MGGFFGPAIQISLKLGCCRSFPSSHSFAEIGDCHEPSKVCWVFHVRCTYFDFRSLPHILFPFFPTGREIGRDMRRKEWEVSSFVTLLFSVNDQILRKMCESQTSLISVADLALAHREIYRARALKTQNDRHKTCAIKVIWLFILNGCDGSLWLM